MVQKKVVLTISVNPAEDWEHAEKIGFYLEGRGLNK